MCCKMLVVLPYFHFSILFHVSMGSCHATVSFLHLTRGLGVLSLRSAKLEGKTQNSEVLMLGLHSRSFGGVKKGTQEGRRKEGEEGRKKQQISTGPSSTIIIMSCTYQIQIWKVVD